MAEAAAALAATFETAARGVIYEHRPASLPAERLATALKPVLAEAGKGSASAFERDAAVVLRRLEEAVARRAGGDRRIGVRFSTARGTRRFGARTSATTSASRLRPSESDEPDGVQLRG